MDTLLSLPGRMFLSYLGKVRTTVIVRLLLFVSTATLVTATATEDIAARPQDMFEEMYGPVNQNDKRNGTFLRYLLHRIYDFECIAGVDCSTSKVDYLGEVLKGYVAQLRNTPNKKVDLVFLVDSSGSVKEEGFWNELKFVKKLLADFTVDRNNTRVAVITFSSCERGVVRAIDHMTEPSDELNKCSLLEHELPGIEYKTGGTCTRGALQEAQVRGPTSTKMTEGHEIVALVVVATAYSRAIE